MDIRHFFDNQNIDTKEPLTLQQQVLVKKYTNSITSITHMHHINEQLRGKPKTLQYLKSHNKFHILGENDVQFISNIIIKSKNSDLLNNITLSSDQETAVKLIINFLYSPNHLTFGLYGYAGTGKTSLITDIIHFLCSHKLVKKVALTAPTHQALNVLKSKMMRHESFKNIDYHTIHRLLQYSNDFDSDGKRIFVKNKHSLMDKYDIVVVDEVSMIGQTILEDIDNEAKEHNTKIWYSGDPAQLTPVNEKISPLFAKDSTKYVDEKMTYTMTKIVRNNDVQISLLCESLRKWITGDITNPKINKFVGARIKLFMSKDLWLKTYLTKTYVDNSNILSWTNRTSNEYNSHIRQHMFKKQVINEYEIGDKIIFNDYYKVADEKVPVSFHTSNMAKIIKIEIVHKQFGEFSTALPAAKRKMKDFVTLESLYTKYITDMNKSTMRYYKLWQFTVIKIANDKFESPVCTIIHVLHSDDNEKYKKDLEYTQQAIKDLLGMYVVHHRRAMKTISKNIISPLWKQRDNIFIKPVASIDYGNARTCHKSQGSTYYNVFIDVPDILLNTNMDDAKRCMYVACSRSSNTVCLLMQY